MKLNGKQVVCLSLETIVIPKADSDYVFKAAAVTDYTDFDKLCPAPVPPTIRKPGQEPQLDINDKNYTDKLTTYAANRYHWMLLQSLKATEGLTFDAVDPSDPDTWGLYEQEFLDAGFLDAEIALIARGVLAANAMDQKKLDEARKRFLATASEAPSK